MKENIPILAALESSDKYKGIRQTLTDGKGAVSVFGLSESHRIHMLSALFHSTDRSMMLILSNDNDCIRFEEQFSAYGITAMHFPAKTQLVSSNAIAVSGGTENKRTSFLVELMQGGKKLVLVSAECLMQRIAPRSALKSSVIHVKCGMETDMSAMIEKLSATGYERTEMCTEVCTYAVRGGRIDVFPSNARYPLRIEFFGDEIDSLRSFDPDEQRSIDMIDSFSIYPATEVPASPDAIAAIKAKLRRTKSGKSIADELEAGTGSYRLNQLIGMIYDEETYISDYMAEDSLFVLCEPLRVLESAENEFTLYSENVRTIIEDGGGGEYLWKLMSSPTDAVSRLPHGRTLCLASFTTPVPGISPKAVYQSDAPSVTVYLNNEDILLHDIHSYLDNDYTVLIFAGRGRAGVAKLFSDHFIPFTESDEICEKDLARGHIVITSQSLPTGYEYRELRLVVITENELFGLSMHRKQAYGTKAVSKKKKETLDLSTLSVGDFVVHEVHGIGRFTGIQEETINGKKYDYMVIQYAGSDVLSVPCDQLDKLQKYVGSGELPPKLSKFGSKEWSNTLQRVRRSVKKLAFDLVALYGDRMSRQGYTYSADTPEQKQLEASFPYDETPDQLTSIADIKNDMEKGIIMDRLLCGDVGFGKTEVALRAAFKAVMDCKQVAFLVPTTILAYQHYNTLRSRYAQFGVRVDFISRFKSQKEIKETLKKLREGEIDVIVGTHRLLSKDVTFCDLGLLIIDEEQRFGVGHKELIKELKKNVDVLTMTATPIPRTMHMSLIGIRDISLLDTPPKQRYPVQTFVAEYNDIMVRDAILKEVARNGQVYVLYNNVSDMPRFFTELSALVPGVSMSFAHGKMGESELERTMLDFIDHKFDVLISSTIIENGLDVPNANTLIVIDADKLGLAQMYQLRGRVGRSNRIGFAYFTFAKNKVLSEVSSKRLESIAQFTQLGSGYKIAMRDLQIRGAGDILGAEQSGHMEEIGYEMYRRLISEAVSEAKGYTAPKKAPDARVEATVDAYIPKTYIENDDRRLEVYERIANIRSDEDLSDVEDELIDRFGDPPRAILNLLNVAITRVHAAECFIKLIAVRERDIAVSFTADAPYDPDKFLAFMRKRKAQFANESGTMITIPEKNADKAKVCASLGGLLRELKSCMEEQK